MAKYIRFELSDTKHAGKPVYDVVNKKSGAPLAMMFWYTRWRRWCATFKEDTVWSADCLQDVAAELERLNKAKVPPCAAS